MLSAITPSMRTNAINENASVAVITATPNRMSLEFLTRQDHSQGGADCFDSLEGRVFSAVTNIRPSLDRGGPIDTIASNC
jgi:hypothetical protein